MQFENLVCKMVTILFGISGLTGVPPQGDSGGVKVVYPHEARLLASRQRTLKSVNCSLSMSLVVVVVDDLEPRPIINSMAFEQMWQPMRQQRFGCMLDAELGGKSLSKLMIIVSNYELMRGNDHGLMSRITQYPVKTYTTHTTTQHSTTQHTYSHVF